jgi:hypothetical protein
MGPKRVEMARSVVRECRHDRALEDDPECVAERNCRSFSPSERRYRLCLRRWVWPGKKDGKKVEGFREPHSNECLLWEQ